MLDELSEHIQGRLFAEYKSELFNNKDAIMQNIETTGENYNVGGQREIIARLLGRLQIAGIVFMFFGQYAFVPFGGINALPPNLKQIFEHLFNNKTSFGLLIFSISMIQSLLM